MATELMGDLPHYCVQLNLRAFLHCGPIQIRTAPSRGHKLYKTYIAVFVRDAEFPVMSIPTT